MKILKGGSAEVKPNEWRKFDIELDESDLQAIVVKNSIDGTQLTVGQKYLLLVKQAEILVALEFESAGLVGDKTVNQLTTEFFDFLKNMPKVKNSDLGAELQVG